tara:strand:- start:76 stop:543 length:468 start_codon:yes stop_codon:yes gene_type:complete
MKIVKYLFIFLFLFGCGYSPIYQTDDEKNIQLDVINIKGDEKISQMIIGNISRFKKNNSTNIFDANLDISKSEIVSTKDKRGNASSYKLLIEIDLVLNKKDDNKSFSKKFSKVSKYNSMDNKFELNQYKNNLEKIMISQILQDINLFFEIIVNDI